jgi:site-specific DNA recombinase
MIAKKAGLVNKNYFLYARKSTDVEDKQVLSIEAQLTELRALAKEQGLPIAQEFVEKQSAKALGRPVFSEMMSRIEKGEAKGLVCWKLDRLARNPVDGGQISWFLQRGIIQHIQTNERSYRPTDNVLLMSVEFGMANQFILDLSNNTKRGLREKVRRGEYPSRADIGYLNDTRTKTIVIDRRKSKIIKEMFELAALGNSTLEALSLFLKDKGVVSKNGKILKRDRIKYILTNPFYYGFFRYAGEIHQGKHQPIVSKQLWDKVQEVLIKRGHQRDNPKNQPKPLCGLLKCAECGCAITAETKTKCQKNGNVHNYLYYRCTKKKGHCSQLAVRDTELDSQLTDSLKTFVMPAEWAEQLNAMADKDDRESARSVGAVVQDLRSKAEDTDRKLQRLLNAYLDQDIEQENYRTEKNRLTSDKKSLEEQIARLEQQRTAWLAPLKQWVRDAEKLGEITLSPELHPKKSFAQKIFGSHPVLKNQKIEFVPPTQWAALRAARQKNSETDLCFILERLTGIEPVSLPWQGRVLPLNHSRKTSFFRCCFVSPQSNP